jgi:DNA-binding transcriptional LysR family regulator
MKDALPHLSTDQVLAFVEVSRHGQIRAAAQDLSITEQGLRNRLLALESQLGVELYRKVRGPRRLTVLTDAGRRFLPHALAFLERAHELCHAFEIETGQQEIRVAASQYLIRYVLIDVLKQFARQEPGIHVRVSTMNEQEVQETLLTDPEVVFGLAAPYEPSPDLVYHELFAMDWSLIMPSAYQLARAPGSADRGAAGRVASRGPANGRGRRSTTNVRGGARGAAFTLHDLANEPLILYERGSTGRQHVLDAFHEQGVTPRIAVETTSTETIVSMVEGGLGISIVPLLPSGAVTRGRRVDVHPLDGSIRPIHSGVLMRRREKPSSAAARLLDFTRSRFDSHAGPRA